MGCGPRLHVMSGGMIMCLAPECPNPGAVTHIISDPETLDVVTFERHHFNVLHPLRERIGGVLLSCPVAAAIAEMDGPPYGLPDGRYRAFLRDDGEVEFEAVITPEGT